MSKITIPYALLCELLFQIEDTLLDVDGKCVEENHKDLVKIFKKFCKITKKHRRDNGENKKEVEKLKGWIAENKKNGDLKYFRVGESEEI